MSGRRAGGSGESRRSRDDRRCRAPRRRVEIHRFAGAVGQRPGRRDDARARKPGACGRWATSIIAAPRRLRAASSDFARHGHQRPVRTRFSPSSALGIEDALSRRRLHRRSSPTPMRIRCVRRRCSGRCASTTSPGVIMSPARGSDAWTLAQQWPGCRLAGRHAMRRMIGSPLALRRARQSQGRATGGRASAAAGHNAASRFVGGDVA